MTEGNHKSRPKRGRPTSADPALIAVLALRVFVERGINVVTMNDIADLAGVSRPTIFRLFPSKACLVWSGMSEFNTYLAEELSNLATEEDLVFALHKAWVRATHTVDKTGEETRLRLKLIASNPEILSWGTTMTLEAKKLLGEFLNRQSTSSAKDFQTEIIVTALMAVSQTSLMWWAAHDDPRSPAEVLDLGFAELENFLSKT